VTVPTPHEIAQDFGIPADLIKHIDPTSPVPVRLMAAAGTLPLPPAVLMSVLYVLIGDPDEKVSTTAAKSLNGMPESLLVSTIDGKTHPKTLEFLAFHRKEPALLETVVLRRQANDRTICFLAETGSADIVEIIASNQERTLITPEIFLHLKANPEAPAALLDRVEGWLRLNGIELEVDDLVEGPEIVGEAYEAQELPPELEYPTPGMLPSAGFPAAPAEAHAVQPDAPTPPPLVTGDDPLMLLLQDMGIPILPEYFDQGLSDEPETLQGARPLNLQPIDVAVDEDAKGDELGISSLMSSMAGATFNFGTDRDGEDDWDLALLEDHGDTIDDELKGTIAMIISKMSVGQKIKLSYLGNKEVREVLIKDTNKMVSAAVVKAGRMTEPEVVKAAANRAINDEVLRLIARNREWVRKYPVKLALVNNPKTPVSTSMGLVGFLLGRDLKSLANNKNVSSVLFTAAKNRLKQKGRR
jgi:hypothetical protein